MNGYHGLGPIEYGRVEVREMHHIQLGSIENIWKNALLTKRVMWNIDANYFEVLGKLAYLLDIL
jgi:hypothetical protein